MITNERQYLITKSQVEKFTRALADAETRPAANPLLAKLEAAALRS